MSQLDLVYRILAIIFPVLAIGRNWKDATREGAIVAIVSSLAINVVFNVASIDLPYGVSAGFIAFVTSIVLFIGVSLMSQPESHDTDEDIARAMEF